MVWSTSTFLFMLSVMVAARQGSRQSSAFTTSSSYFTAEGAAGRKKSSISRSVTTSKIMTSDTPETLPDFSSAEEYLKYMNSVSQLPKGFATGTGSGTFVSQETPSLGNLPIRVALIQLTDGPSDSWAACFTSNKVSTYEKDI